MAKTKHMKHKYYSTEEEEEAMRKMEEEGDRRGRDRIQSRRR